MGKAIWAQGVRGVDFRIRVRLARLRTQTVHTGHLRQHPQGRLQGTPDRERGDLPGVISAVCWVTVLPALAQCDAQCTVCWRAMYVLVQKFIAFTMRAYSMYSLCIVCVARVCTVCVCAVCMLSSDAQCTVCAHCTHCIVFCVYVCNVLYFVPAAVHCSNI